MRNCGIAHRSRQARGAAAGGFTLIELILALGLTAVIAALLASSVFIAFHARTAINASLDAARAGDETSMLAEELASSIPPTPPPTTNLLTVTGLPQPAADPTTLGLVGPFEGLEDNVDFYTTGPEPKAGLQPDVRHVQYLLVDDTNGTKMLVRHVFRNFLPIDTSEVPPDEVVCRNVLNLTLSYFDGNAWNPTWDSVAQNNTLPLVVQFTLELGPLEAGGQSRVTLRTVPVICGQPAPDPSTTGDTQ